MVGVIGCGIKSVGALVLLDKGGMGGGPGLYELKGAGCHCFEDHFADEWGGGKHGDAMVVCFAAGGGAEGAQCVSANDGGCYDVCRRLGTFALCSNGRACIESDDVGVGAQAKEGRDFVVELENGAAIVF